MARKTQTLRIETPGRDEGKVFLITELSAQQGDKWAARALHAMAGAGVDVPDFQNAPMAEVARAGLTALARVPFDILEPLYDEMMACVQIIPDPSRPQVQRAIVESDIEEISTLAQLRWNTLLLHMGFFTDGGTPISG